LDGFPFEISIQPSTLLFILFLSITNFEYAAHGVFLLAVILKSNSGGKPYDVVFILALIDAVCRIGF
jgi:general stress protein CsbA